ncbi:hypothetical protein [Mucilaginibacter sp.]|uniref:hypothetical protein n=1 Tax=Mucilaginibacter sp. TaxID=1882438 RepID=UPI0025D79E2F|nr:hypothetical protein [Mucilaginibacter sp.]
MLAKAIDYRFYKHVQFVDGYYVCDLKNAKDINISPANFTSLLNNLNQTNSFAKITRAQGKKIEMQPIDDKYLNSLLGDIN